jgi:hypothetical protein
MLRRSVVGVQKLQAIYWAGRYTKKEEPMGTNGVSPKREVVQFTPNQPVTLALKYATPKIGLRPGGEDYAMFTTVDGRVLFCDVEVARQITDLGVKPGEEFSMRLEWTGRRGDPKYYHVWLDEPAVAVTAEAVETPLEARLRESVALAQYRKTQNGAAVDQTTAPVPPAASKPQGTVTSTGLPTAWAEPIAERAQQNIELYWYLVHWAQDRFPGITKREVSSRLMSALISGERGQRFR